MALQVKRGNIFDNLPEKYILVHGCNGKGVMGSGIAKEVKRRYPQAFDAYIRAALKYGLKLGQIITWETGDVVIVNAITQRDYGRNPSIVYVDYGAVVNALDAVVGFAKQYKPDVPILLPFIGGGLGNGDPDTLMGIFEKCFKNVDATLYIK